MDKNLAQASTRFNQAAEWNDDVWNIQFRVKVAAPEVIAGQVDVLPAQRRQVLQQRVIHALPWPRKACVARSR
jgi:hypothetical protein